MIFDEPTRGVDVSAIPQIHAAIRKLAAEHKAVVVISSYLPEILAISDRILVARGGRIVEEMSRPTPRKTRSCMRPFTERRRRETLPRTVAPIERRADRLHADDGRLAQRADRRPNSRSAVLSGEMRPGMRIRQELLAAQFGASRIPVREALKQLENEGLVVLAPNRGAWIADVNSEESIESLQDPRGGRTAGDFRERAEPDGRRYRLARRDCARTGARHHARRIHPARS